MTYIFYFCSVLSNSNICKRMEWMIGWVDGCYLQGGQAINAAVTEMATEETPWSLDNPQTFVRTTTYHIRHTVKPRSLDSQPYLSTPGISLLHVYLQYAGLSALIQLSVLRPFGRPRNTRESTMGSPSSVSPTISGADIHIPHRSIELSRIFLVKTSLAPVRWDPRSTQKSNGQNVPLPVSAVV